MPSRKKRSKPPQSNRALALNTRLHKKLDRDISHYAGQVGRLSRWSGAVAAEVVKCLESAKVSLMSASQKVSTLKAIDAPGRKSRQKALKSVALDQAVRLGPEDLQRVRVELGSAHCPEQEAILQGTWTVIDEVTGVRQLSSNGGKEYKHLFLTNNPLYPAQA